MWPSLEVVLFTDYAITFKREPLRLFTTLGHKDNRFRFQTISRKNLHQYKKIFYSFQTFHGISGFLPSSFTEEFLKRVSWPPWYTYWWNMLTCNMLLLSLWVLWCVWFCVYKISVAFLRAICLESFHVTLLFTMLLFCCCFWDIMHLFSNEISIICWMFRSDSVGSSCSPNSYTLHTNFTLPSPSSSVKQARSCCTVLSSQFTLQVWKCAVIGTPILVHAT